MIHIAICEDDPIYLRELEKTIKETKETICNDPQVCSIVDLPVYYELETHQW